MSYDDNLNLEYLPDDANELEIKNKEKTEKKLKDFRQYIVDKGVVLAFTKGKFYYNNSFIESKIFRY